MWCHPTDTYRNRVGGAEAQEERKREMATASGSEVPSEVMKML